MARVDKNLTSIVSNPEFLTDVVAYFGHKSAIFPCSLLETYDAVVGLLRAVLKKFVATEKEEKEEKEVTSFKAENMAREPAWPVMGAKIP